MLVDTPTPLATPPRPVGLTHLSAITEVLLMTHLQFEFFQFFRFAILAFLITRLPLALLFLRADTGGVIKQCALAETLSKLIRIIYYTCNLIFMIHVNYYLLYM